MDGAQPLHFYPKKQLTSPRHQSIEIKGQIDQKNARTREYLYDEIITQPAKRVQFGKITECKSIFNATDTFVSAIRPGGEAQVQTTKYGYQLE